MLLKRPFNHSIKVNPAEPHKLPAKDNASNDNCYEVRVNGRWLCYDHNKPIDQEPDFKETDRYPVMLIDTRTGHVIYCTSIEIHGESWTHTALSDAEHSRNSVRVQTISEVTIR